MTGATGPADVAAGAADREELQAVLFDMDGTLVDSEKVWSVGLDDLARHYGGTISPGARAAMVGTSMVESMRILHGDIGQPGRPLDQSMRLLTDRVKELFAEGLVWRPGARELVEAVRAAGLPTALVTATVREVLEVALGSIGAHLFDAVVAGDDVERTKPDPLPYLTAARRVGADPARCVAVEDSPNGVLSALRAGCAVVAVPCDVEVPHGPRIMVRSSLVGVDVVTLRRWVRDCRAA